MPLNAVLYRHNEMTITAKQSIQVEGLSVDELLTALNEDGEALVFCGSPIVFRAGTARVLGQFEIEGDRMVLELAHIDGGGEGVLPLLASIAQKYARGRGIKTIDWLVYATACANPNPKLRRVLDRRGFLVKDVVGKGVCFFQSVTVE